MVLCDPHSCWYRYILLLMIIYIRVATFYCIEILTGLQEAVVKLFKINSAQYNILFSAYAWPLLIFSSIGSIIIDRVIGRSVGLVCSVSCGLFGMLLFVTAVYFNSYAFQVVGRFFLGLGEACCFSISMALITLWFQDKIFFALSFIYCSSRLGASLGIVVPQIIYNYMPLHLGNLLKLNLTFLSGAILLLISIVCSIIFVFLHLRGIKYSVIHFPDTSINISSADLKDFSVKFWLASICVGLYYSVIFTYVANAQLFLISKYEFTAQQANSVTFLVFASPVLFNPLIGYIVQNTGYNIYWGIFGATIGTISLLLSNLASIQQYFMSYIISVVFAFSYSFICICILSIPSMIVQEHQLATAYSFMYTFIGIGMLSMSIISGFVIDRLGYTWLMIYFTFVTFSVLMILVLMAVIDYYTDSSSDRRANKAGRWIIQLKTKLKNEHLNLHK